MTFEERRDLEAALAEFSDDERQARECQSISPLCRDKRRLFQRPSAPDSLAHTS